METLITGVGCFAAGILFFHLYHKTQSDEIQHLRAENRELKRKLSNLKSWATQLLLAQKRDEKKKAEKSEKSSEKISS